MDAGDTDEAVEPGLGVATELHDAAGVGGLVDAVSVTQCDKVRHSVA